MLVSTAVTEIRARLQELTADFWTSAEVLNALNEGVKRFSAQEKWHWLQTVVTNGSLSADDPTFDLPGNVDVNQTINVQVLFSGDTRPRRPKRVTAAEGFERETRDYRAQSEPVAYYLSAAAQGLVDIQTLELNDIAATDTFKLTHNALESTAITYSADMTAAITSALEGLASFEPGDLVVTMTDTNTYVVTFRAALGAVSALTITSPVGFTPTGVTNTQDGTLAGGYIQTVTFVPVMNRAATIKYLYHRFPSLVSASTDPIDVPEQYAMGPVAYATGLLWLKELQDSRKADEQFALYMAVVDDAKKNHRKLAQDSQLSWGSEGPTHYQDPDYVLSYRSIPVGGLG